MFTHSTKSRISLEWRSWQTAVRTIRWLHKTSTNIYRNPRKTTKV